MPSTEPPLPQAEQEYAEKQFGSAAAGQEGPYRGL